MQPGDSPVLVLERVRDSKLAIKRRRPVNLDFSPHSFGKYEKSSHSASEVSVRRQWCNRFGS